MGCPIITITKVVSRKACVVVVDLRFIASEYFCHDCIDTIASFLGKTLSRNQVVLQSKPDHSFCIDDLIDPIEVSFK